MKTPVYKRQGTAIRTFLPFTSYYYGLPFVGKKLPSGAASARNAFVVVSLCSLLWA
jgi:hypothetical protein